MAQFTADIQATLNTSKLETQIRNIKTPLQISNFQVDKTSLKSQLQTAINNTPFTLTVGGIQFKNAGNVGRDIGNTLNEQINKQLDTGSFAASIARVRAEYERLGGGGNAALNDIRTNIQNLIRLQDEMSQNRGTADAITSYREFNSTLTTVRNSLSTVSSDTKRFASSLQVATLDNKMSQWLDQNRGASSQFRNEISNLQTRLRELSSGGQVTTSEFKRLDSAFKEAAIGAQQSSNTFRGLTTNLTSTFKQLTGFYSVVQVIRQSIQVMREMVNEVTAVDTAMTGLYRVTNLTQGEYTKLYSDMVSSAKEYGSTLTDIINSTTDWVKLGFGADVAQELGNVTAMYQHVTDLDSDTAVKNLVTAYKGYQDQLLELTGGDQAAAVEYIADIFDKLNNEFAVTAADVGQGLTVCASALQVAGNSIQESSAMLTGITEVTQNASKAGAALRILSMRLRGTTAKELEELGEDSEGVIEVTSKLQSTIKDLSGVDITDTNGELRSTYDIMNDIAKVWDSLDSNRQANVLETISGKNRASDIAALIRNWDQVKKAFEASTNAWGTAAHEQDIYVDSIQGKLNQLQTSWQAFANDFISSDTIKFGVDSLKAILEVLDKLVQTFGGFGTIGMGILSFSFITKAIPPIKTFYQIIQQAGLSVSSFQYATHTLAESFTSFIKTPLGAVTAIGAVTAAIGLAVNAYQSYKQAQSEARQKTIEESNATIEKAAALEQNYITIQKYIGQTDLTEAQEQEFSSAVAACADALDGKTVSLNDAADAQKAYLQKLRETSTEELKAAQTAAKQASKAAEDELKDTVWGSFTGSQISIDLSGRTGIKEFTDALEVAKEVMGDFIDEGTYGKELEPIDWDSNHKNMDAVVEYYYKLIELRDTLTDMDLMDNDIYENANGIINSIGANVNQYVESKQEELEANYLVAHGIPTTIEEYIAMREAILNSIDASEEFKQALSDNLDADYSNMFDIEGYEHAAERLKTIRKEFAAATIHLYPDDIDFGKKQFDRMLDWYDSLPDDQKEIVYDISLNPEIDTSEWDISDWRKQLQAGIEETQTLSFGDLVVDKSFSEEIDTYKGKLDILQDALEKIQNNKLTPEDKIDLFEAFPSLSGEEDLAGAIEDQIETVRDAVNDFLDKQEKLVRPEDMDAFKAYRESINDYIDTLVKGVDPLDQLATAISGVQKASDLLTKSQSGELGVLETLEAAADLAKDSGKDISTFLTDGFTLDEQAVEDWANGLVDALEGKFSPEVLQGLRDQITAEFEQTTAFDKLSAAMTKVSNAQKLIADANDELSASGKNSMETLSSLMDLYGKDWVQYVKSTASGGIEIDTAKIKQNMLDSIDALEEVTPQIKQTLKDALEVEIEQTSFKDYTDNYVSNIEKLQEALEKLRSGEFTASDQYELFTAFPKLASDADDLETAITKLMLSMNSDIMAAFGERLANAKTDEERAEILGLMQTIQQLQKVAGEDIVIDIEVETQGLESFYNAIEESNSATGLTSESIKSLTSRYKDLEDVSINISDIFLGTATGIRLNNKELQKLESAYQKQRRAKLDRQIESLKEEYEELTEQINASTDAASAINLDAQRNSVLDQINELSMLAAQYDGLYNNYNKWIEAQSTPNAGDAYDTYKEGLEKIDKLYQAGDVGTDDFRTGVQLMTNQDLTFASTGEIVKAYEEGRPKMKRYFDDANKGCENFLKDLNKADETFAHLNENGEWELDIDTEKWADALGISVEAVEMMLGKLSDKGFDIQLDIQYQDLETVQEKAQKAAEALEDMGKTKYKFDLDTTNISRVEEQITEAQKIYEEFVEVGEDGIVHLKTDAEGFEEAQYLLSALILKRQELNKPFILQIDVSNVSGAEGEVLRIAQQLAALQQLRELQIETHVDTGDTDSQIQQLSTELSTFDKDLLTKLGITVSVEDGEATADISNLTEDKTMTVTTDYTKIGDSELDKEASVKYEGDFSAITDASAPELKGSVTYEGAFDGIGDDDAPELNSSVTYEGDFSAITDTSAPILNGKIRYTSEFGSGTQGGTSTPTSSNDKTAKIRYYADYSQLLGDAPEKTGKVKYSADFSEASSTAAPEKTAKVKYSADMSAVDKTKAKDKSATVKYGINTSSPSNYKPSGKSATVTYKVNSSAVSNYTPPNKTAWVTYKTRGGAGVDGTAHAAGTASGRAYASGNWGTKTAGVALGGELGRKDLRPHIEIYVKKII